MAGFSPGVTTHAAYDPTGILINGPTPRRITTRTLISGQNLPAGRLCGMITASQKFTGAISTASDGSQLPSQMAILLDACDASGGDKVARFLELGDFDWSKITFTAGGTFSQATLDFLLGKSGLVGHASYAITE